MSKWALISLSCKQHIESFARTLVQEFNYRLLSTGGTAKVLENAGLEVTHIAQHTDFPELFQGRLKTLHPKIHGGILADRQCPTHLKQAMAQHIELIDLVAVNLYNFQSTIDNPQSSFKQAIENIDIGGCTLLRAGAKNHENVWVVSDQADYQEVLEALRQQGRCLPLRRRLAEKAFCQTAHYDLAISQWLATEREKKTSKHPTKFPQQISLTLQRTQILRYGENPHQAAALYGPFHEHFQQLSGKELSYNNLLDLSAAAELVQEFKNPSIAIIKHRNPCAVASAQNLSSAFQAALATDPQAAYGGVVSCNGPINAQLAKELSARFFEIIVAPSFEPPALSLLSKKKSTRLIRIKTTDNLKPSRQIRSILGAWLLQDADTSEDPSDSFEVVSQRPCSEEQYRALLFAWRVVKHINSNAIVFTKEARTLGIGAGQMSRIDSVKLAAWKAKKAHLNLKGSVLASDAFFPFPDSVIAAAAAGAVAIIQPGGSLRDEAVIEAANAEGLSMVFTGKRHFRH